MYNFPVFNINYPSTSKILVNKQAQLDMLLKNLKK